MQLILHAMRSVTNMKGGDVRLSLGEYEN